MAIEQEWRSKMDVCAPLFPLPLPNISIISSTREAPAPILGSYASYMEKEIFEQPDSTDRTLKGRIDFDNYKGL